MAATHVADPTVLASRLQLYSSDNTSIYPTAKGILLAGFIVQIVSLGFFAIQAAVYQTRVKRSGEPEGKWSLCLYTLYIGSIFILIRGIFRTIEFGSGGNNTGYLLEHEAFCKFLRRLPRPWAVLTPPPLPTRRRLRP